MLISSNNMPSGIRPQSAEQLRQNQQAPGKQDIETVGVKVRDATHDRLGIRGLAIHWAFGEHLSRRCGIANRHSPAPGKSAAAIGSVFHLSPAGTPPHDCKLDIL